MPKFVHLHTHSHYSLLDGLSKIPDLVKHVKNLGMDAVAVTDHGVLYGTVEFYKAAKKAGIKPILGVETYVAPRDRFSKEPNERYYHLILLCENETGWKNLIKLVSKAHLEGFYYRPRVDKDLLREHHEGLIALSACVGGEIGQALLAGRTDDAKKIAEEYREIFGPKNYFLEIQKHPHIPDSEKIEPLLIALSKETGIPLVATQDSHYLRSEDNEYHDVLLAVQTGNKLADDDRMSMKEDDFSVLSPEAMMEKFAAVPGGAEAVERTAEIAARCNAELELGKTLLPEFAKPDGKTANNYLRELIEERLPKRFPPEMQTEAQKKEMRDRVEYEFAVIEKTGFADYFLIVQDLIMWAKLHGIAVGPGRGSAAGSIISYILGITELNPLTYGLLFERFLNPERIQMPDIDIDFADVRRDEVLAYAREKYGDDHVARIITFGTMAARAAIRDAGRAMGYSYAFCDQIAKLIPFNPTQGMKEGWLDECLRKVAELKALYDANPEAKKLIDTARHLEGVARHASVHACGTVIAKEPLMERVPLQFAPQDKDITITQFEMHAVEDLGLLKIDFLGLKNLTIIENAIRLIKELRGDTIDISKIPLDDKKTFEVLQKADTTGVFQFECLSGDTIVSNTTIKRLYERQNKNRLLSVYVDQGKVHKNKILGIAKSGIKEVYALIAENGWHIKASAEHQFLTDNGWKKLKEIKAGDAVLMKNKAKHVLLNTTKRKTTKKVSAKSFLKENKIPAGFGFISVKEIRPVGREETYDIAMEAPGNNFIANGFVVHNSSGMRRYMKDIKPTELEDLIALVALFRPGPLELIPSFIKRKHGKEKITYLHPKLEPILKNTHGIGVYQEQMMQIARDLGGYTLPEADTLRKAIGKKIKSLLDEQAVKLTQGMIKNGIPERTAKAIWELFPPFARYGFNKCLPESTTIQDPKTGARVTIGELYRHEKELTNTFSLRETNGAIFTNRIVDIVNNGVKPIFELVTRSGRRIKATANHPFLTADGWKNLEQLSPDEQIATPRILPEPTHPLTVEPHKLAVLGYLLAEGNLCHPASFYFYSTSEEEIRDYVQNLEQFKNTMATLNRSKSAVSVYAKRATRSIPSEAVEWIDSIGMRGKTATEKTIPEIAFQLKNDDLAILIAKMFQGDGCINFKNCNPQIFYATSSRIMATDLQHLLLRFGIISTIHEKRFKYRDGEKTGFTVQISRHDNIKQFIKRFSPHLVGKKKEACCEIMEQHPILNGSIAPWSARGSNDTIPSALVMPLVREAIAAGGMSLKQSAREHHFAERLLYTDTRKTGFLRETAAYLSTVFENAKLSDAAESDIHWDKVVSITYAGQETTYDLTMEEDHNFIANNIFVHNSHAACYALIGYQTAYLKAHYPEEFMAALLNAEVSDIERISFLIQEAKQSGLTILPPDINKSFVAFTPEGEQIRFGLEAVKNVGTEITKAIIEERTQRGPFKNFEDVLMRIQHKDLNKKSLESLVKAGAFESLGIERNQALANMDDIVRFASAARKNGGTGGQNGGSLFGDTMPAASLKLKPAPPATNAEKLIWEKELIGFYLSEHPLTAFATLLKNAGSRPIAELMSITNERLIVRTAGVVTKMRKIITKNGQPMIFATIEDQSQKPLEVVVFSSVLEKTATVWVANAPVIVQGHISPRDGEVKFICDNAKRLG